MNYYILFYHTADDYLEKRTQFRPEHLALANKYRDEGTLIMAGALADPPDKAILVFRGETSDVAESFAKSDPYVKNGVVTSWEVRKWTVVVGH